MNLAELLVRQAATFADRPAVSVGAAPVHTYAELARRSAGLARSWRDRFGLSPGDRVAILMKNGPAYFETLFSAWIAGLAVVPINAKLHGREFAYILENSGAAIAVVSPDLAETVAPLVAEIETLHRVLVAAGPDWRALVQAEPLDLSPAAPDDLAWLFYTSGTTGRPKGAMLSHRNLMAMTMNYFADVDAIAPGDCMIHAAPLSHGSGVYALPHVAKAANNVVPESGGFQPAECLDLIERWPGISFFFAPTMVHRLIAEPRLAGARLDNLKTLIYGGGPMYVADLKAALDALGPKLVQIYGQGEAPMTITGLPKAMHAARDHPRYLARLGSAGIARTDVAVRVVDAQDRPLPPGETGEIVAQGDVVMAGYWRNPEATAKTLAGGWLHTGDVGSFDRDGFLTLKDRAKDMIISGGSNIYPREVEEVLLRHPDVAEVSVVGRPHADWGEEVVAFVVRRDGETAEPAEPAALDRLCLDHIARFKRPKDYVFVDALPKNNYGKVLKTALRDRLAS